MIISAHHSRPSRRPDLGDVEMIEEIVGCYVKSIDPYAFMSPRVQANQDFTSTYQ